MCSAFIKLLCCYLFFNFTLTTLGVNISLLTGKLVLNNLLFNNLCNAIFQDILFNITTHFDISKHLFVCRYAWLLHKVWHLHTVKYFATVSRKSDMLCDIFFVTWLTNWFYKTLFPTNIKKSLDSDDLKNKNRVLVIPPTVLQKHSAIPSSWQNVSSDWHISRNWSLLLLGN